MHNNWGYGWDCGEQTDTTILFKDLILNNTEDIKSYMTWENYGLNDNVLAVVEPLKEHALIVLMNSYGLFHVEQDILEPFMSDVFIHFPVLMQQLAITRLIDAYGVATEDTNTDTLTRTEKLLGETNQNSSVTAGTTTTDTNEANTQQKTTGTIAVDNVGDNNLHSKTTIENSSGVEATGNRSVNVSHNLPEQALNGQTGNFPVDPQGTPELNSAFIQTAAASYNTSNPINTTETSNQTVDNSNTVTNNSTTTNDVTVADSGTTTRTTVNSGSDSTDATTLTDNTNTIEETRTQKTTNKQYAYEIKAFLETADSLIAFKKWEDNFAWVVGIQ